ncbi:tigger transposable element-derived protein 1-like [Nerophis ophidion]|uniref:tigger transposable element-derived protein 1-like n=1 Tax=Nerophis ophidion TaxID=159077 RepID=UPI002ADFF121|nr:tigger transposable element-derived protein 1-like [Nerophis ophidion]XP_061756782.1 tigger transposable element-derived protein 1-like [Nerophis ophidion]XP_061756783.1 tigger transposable element-derived protein 1-like [Nerophis ophidion]
MPPPPKRTNVTRTIELKKELIAKFESGARVSDLAAQYKMAKSTISTILKRKEAIKAADVAKGVKILTSKRHVKMEEVEKILLEWVTERQLKGEKVSEPIICEKARQLYGDLIRDSPGDSADDFKASRGWFEKFKKRSGIRYVVRKRETVRADKQGAKKFVEEFQRFAESEGFLPQQVFNCDETGLFWKKMPKKTYITREEKSLPGHKPMKDRLTLLLCANASGDCKVKPLLVYHSETPRAFKKNNVQKDKLTVMWRSNPKALVTRQFFTEWFQEVFAPSVEEYLTEKNLPLKVLLVLDAALTQPTGLGGDWSSEHDSITVKFLPPNTTPLLQPMDQQVISNFKKLYTKALFQRCFEVTMETNLTLREFWKDHLNILHCLSIIETAWEQVSKRMLQCAWRKLWPVSVVPRFFEGFELDPVLENNVVDEIVSLGKFMGLEVDSDDVEELVEEHTLVLSTDEVQAVHGEQQQEVPEELSSEEEDTSCIDNIPTAEIKELLGYWAKTQSLVAKWHPSIGVVKRNINLFDGNVVEHFRKILKSRKRQAALDNILSKEEASCGSSSATELQASFSGVKRGRKDCELERDLDEDFME